MRAFARCSPRRFVSVVFDARHVIELKRGRRSDPEQLAFAVKQRRGILTHNVRDYVLLDREYRAQRQPHHGILVCDQVPFRELLRRTLRCLGRRSDADIRNQVVWLHEFK